MVTAPMRSSSATASSPRPSTRIADRTTPASAVVSAASTAFAVRMAAVMRSSSGARAIANSGGGMGTAGQATRPDRWSGLSDRTSWIATVELPPANDAMRRATQSVTGTASRTAATIAS